MRKRTVGSVLWSVASWGASLGILVAAYCGWRFFGPDGWTALYISAGAAAVLFIVQKVAARAALGWVIDEQGERQKVQAWNRGLAIAEALIKIEEHDPHWSESAQGLITAVVMWEVKVAKANDRLPLLANVRYLMTEGDIFEPDHKGKPQRVGGFRHTVERMIDEGGPQIESLISRFKDARDEIVSIQSTVDRQTAWILSQPMSDNLACNDIEFSDLKKRSITVYVVLPAERMRTHSVWLRLVIVSALRALYKPGGLKTLFLMDEFATLGHLAPIEDAFGLVRGYGVQLWPVLQDKNQLADTYKGRWQSFVGNAGVVHGFAPGDPPTAEWMSQMAGDTTAVAAGYNAGDSQSTGKPSQSHGMSYQQIVRKLFLPQELKNFPKGNGIIFPADTSLSITYATPPYWDLPDCKPRADPNPYY